MFATLTKILFVLLALGALLEEHDPARVQRTRTRTRTEVSGSRVRGKDDQDPDGPHEAIVPTWNETQVTVVLTQFDSLRGVVRACMALGAWPGLSEETILHGHPAPGCDAFNPATKVCTILTLRPRFVEDTDRMENLGHEALHCFEGQFHHQD